MSTEKQKTIADIVAEMRECAGRMEKRGLYDLRECGTDYLRALSDLIEAAHQREVAELRECLKEAIREKCPFTRMSCKYGEPCDYECGTVKWRKVLEMKKGAEDEGK